MLKQTSPNQLTALALLDAQALVERGWCQLNCALDVNGQPTTCLDARAASFCTYGAMDRVLGGKLNTVTEPAWEVLRSVTDGSPIDFNDAPGRTQAEVIAMFGRAAEVASSAK